MTERAVSGRRALALALSATAALALAAPSTGAQEPLRLFISVDMEGIGGIGTSQMSTSGGKDYNLGRELMTEEVNAVVAEIFANDPGARILVNDSHGDHQNVLHTRLDPRVTYIQGSIKPLGMVQGLDGSFDGAIFIGYHAKAGDPDGFAAHTGSGSVKGLWINGVEVGEGGMNAAFAGSHGVPVLLVAGDSAATAELHDLLGSEVVTTKTAETPSSARMLHPERVRALLRAGTRAALERLAHGGYQPYDPGEPVTVRMRLASTTHVDILLSIPGVTKVDGFTVQFTSPDADRAYRIIRLMYRFVRI